MATMIKISDSKPIRAPSKKNARGGARKWTLHHLPDGTADVFTKTIVPLAKLKAGTLPPWHSLSEEDVKSIVDEVFDENDYDIREGDVWCDLVRFIIVVGLLLT
jgi:hypothetical protein